jgi:Transposase
MKSADQSYAAFVGIDWADQKHDVCLKAAGSDGFERSVIAHRPEAIERWAHGLRERFAGEPIAVCLEIARGPLVSALQRYEFLVLFPVNPSTLASYRSTFCVSGAKDDPTDAELALELLLRHPERNCLCYSRKVRPCASSRSSSSSAACWSTRCAVSPIA